MMITACITLFMPAQVGSRILNHFGWIHSFSFLTKKLFQLLIGPLRKEMLRFINEK